MLIEKYFRFDVLKLDAEEKSIQLLYNSKLLSDLYLVTDREKLYAILTNLVKMPLNTRMKAQ
jgi:hypothetical protein